MSGINPWEGDLGSQSDEKSNDKITTKLQKILDVLNTSPTARRYQLALYTVYGPPPNDDIDAGQGEVRRSVRTFNQAKIKIGFSIISGDLSVRSYGDTARADKDSRAEATELAEVLQAIELAQKEPNVPGRLADILFEWADMMHLAYYAHHLTKSPVPAEDAHDVFTKIATFDADGMPSEILSLRSTIVQKHGVEAWLSCLQHLAYLKLQTMDDAENPRNKDKQYVRGLTSKADQGDQVAADEKLEWKKKRDKWEKNKLAELIEVELTDDRLLADESISATLQLVKRSLTPLE